MAFAYSTVLISVQSSVCTFPGEFQVHGLLFHEEQAGVCMYMWIPGLLMNVFTLLIMNAIECLTAFYSCMLSCIVSGHVNGL